MRTFVFLFGLALILSGSADAQFNNGQSVGTPGFGNNVPIAASNWILATGNWNDSGIWVDGDVWID